MVNCVAPRRAVCDLIRLAYKHVRLPEPDAAATIIAAHMLADQFDPGVVQRADHFHQAGDYAANIALAGLHSLDCRQGDAGHLGQGFLVDIEKGAGGTKLGRGDHRRIGVCV